MIRIKYFVDYPNFMNSLKDAGLSVPQARSYLKNIRNHSSGLISDLVPRGQQFDVRAVNFYGSCAESAANDDGELRWMREELDAVQGHSVYILRRSAVDQTCEAGHDTSRQRERGVDTLIVSDLVSLSMNNLFDLAVLATNDSDLIPAVEMVQSRLDKQVIHLGVLGRRPAIRGACWGHIDLKISIDDAEKRETKTSAERRRRWTKRRPAPGSGREEK